MTITTTRRERRRIALIAAFIAAIVLALVVSACTSSSNGNTAEGNQQNTDTSQLEQNQPLPEFTTSAYRMEVIQIEAIEALGAPTTAFFFPEGTTVVVQSGKEVFSAPPLKSCPAEGEPVPNTASLSNPQAPYQGSINTGADDPVVGQMDPNGVYVPQSSSGTYVLCDNANGGHALAYWEGPVFDESGTAVWSDTQGIVDVGTTALPTCKIVYGTDNSGNPTEYYHCTVAGRSVNSATTKADVTPAA